MTPAARREHQRFKKQLNAVRDRISRTTALTILVWGPNPSAGGEVVWTEGHPFDAVPVLRLLQQTIEAFDGSSEGELRLRFSNGDRLTVAREDGPEGFTIHHIGQPLIVG